VQYSLVGSIFVGTAETAEVSAAVVAGESIAAAAAGPATIILGGVFALGLVAVAIANC
jgi:formate/nitrite transporter FocA (FNT family)